MHGSCPLFAFVGQCALIPHLRSIAQLKNAGITLVSIREATLLDHCVAVLGVSDTLVTIADPVTGIEVLSHRQFERKWHACGIVVSKNAPKSL